MKRLITIITLLACFTIAKGQQTYFTPGVPPSSNPFSPTFRVKTTGTDSLNDLYLSIGNKWYQIYTAPQSWSYFSRRFKGSGKTTSDKVDIAIGDSSATTLNNFAVFRNANGDLVLPNINFAAGTNTVIFNGIKINANGGLLTNLSTQTARAYFIKQDSATGNAYKDTTVYGPLWKVNTKQATLISGTNLKTVNGNSLLGSGNIVISSPIQHASNGLHLSGDTVQMGGVIDRNTDIHILAGNYSYTIGDELASGNGLYILRSTDSSTVVRLTGGNKTGSTFSQFYGAINGAIEMDAGAGAIERKISIDPTPSTGGMFVNDSDNIGFQNAGDYSANIKLHNEALVTTRMLNARADSISGAFIPQFFSSSINANLAAQNFQIIDTASSNQLLSQYGSGLINNEIVNTVDGTDAHTTLSKTTLSFGIYKDFGSSGKQILIDTAHHGMQVLDYSGYGVTLHDTLDYANGLTDTLSLPPLYIVKRLIATGGGGGAGTIYTKSSHQTDSLRVDTLGSKRLLFKADSTYLSINNDGVKVEKRFKIMSGVGYGNYNFHVADDPDSGGASLYIGADDGIRGQRIYNDGTICLGCTPNQIEPPYEVTIENSGGSSGGYFGAGSLVVTPDGIPHNQNSISPGDNSDQLATTAYVDAAISGGAYLTASNFVTAEVPSGSINSSNTSFTLANTPISGTVQIFRNGALQIVGTDYTISGTAITYLYAPTSGVDTLRANYIK